MGVPGNTYLSRALETHRQTRETFWEALPFSLALHLI